VKLATHIVTGHKVAVKILNKAKIKHLGMEEKVERGEERKGGAGGGEGGGLLLFL